MRERTWQAKANDVESQGGKLTWPDIKDKIHREDMEDIISKNKALKTRKIP